MGTKWQATIKTLIKPSHPPPAGFTGRGLINIHENVKLSMSWLPRSVSACKTGRMWNVQKKNVNGGYLFHLPTMSTVGPLAVFLYNKKKWERDNRTVPFYSHKDWKDFNRLIVNRVPISTCAFDFNNQTATIEHMKYELDFKVIHVSGDFSWRPHAVMDNSSLNCTFLRQADE